MVSVLKICVLCQDQLYGKPNMHTDGVFNYPLIPITVTEFFMTIPNIIKQTNEENEEKIPITRLSIDPYQILRTNILRIVWKTVRRIIIGILGVEG